MRLFVGFRPTAAAIAHLTGAVDRIRDPQEAPPTAPDVRWTPSQRWHITLAFLGEVDPDRVPALEGFLSQVAARHPQIRGIHLAASGTFGRVLWVGVHPAHSPDSPSRSQDPLARLARAVGQAADEAHIPLEHRPWRPHLSVARSRGADLRTAERLLRDYTGPAFTADQFELVHSVTGPEPHHAILRQFSLQRRM